MANNGITMAVKLPFVEDDGLLFSAIHRRALSSQSADKGRRFDLDGLSWATIR